MISTTSPVRGSILFTGEARREIRIGIFASVTQNEGEKERRKLEQPLVLQLAR
jgi:hypothetical protein